MINVIYHRSDFDGIFCREIAKKFLGQHEVNYYGLEYGDPLPQLNPQDTLYILDFSVPEFMNYPYLIWIDHHKSAIEKFGTKNGIQLDGVAACRLAYQWFSGSYNQGSHCPCKDNYINREVNEPFAVTLAGEYDIWDKRDYRAELFQHGLRSQELTEDNWNDLLYSKHTIGFASLVQSLLTQGKCLQFAKTKENASIIKAIGFDLEWEGLKFLACNHASYNSFLFTAGIKPEHDALFGFKWTGKDWSVSLYHAPGKEHHDLSLLAVKHGGGGHKGACGFRCKSLPFLT